MTTTYFVHESTIWVGLSKDNLSQLNVASSGVAQLATGESTFRVSFSHGGEFDALYWL